MQEALKESMERFQRLAENAPDIIFRYNFAGDGGFEYISPAVEKITGYSPQEFYDDPMLGEKIIHAEDQPMARDMARTGLKSGLPVTIRWVRKDGAPIWVERVDVWIYDSSGQRIATEGIIRDITARKKAEEELRVALEKLGSSLESTIDAIAMMSELRDPYTAGHQRRVTQLALAIAAELGLPDDRIQPLRVAGLLHDVGKVYVPSEILSKPGKLTSLELGLAKAHAEASYNIVRSIKFSGPVAHIVWQHHERMDGSGYPQGLAGDQIMLEARILAVADVVEAMVSHRPYRPALGLEKALDEITRNRAILYDAQVVDACLVLFNDKGFQFQG